MAERHPVDAAADELVRTYAAAVERLEGIIRAGLARGLDPSRIGTAEQIEGDATLAYRRRQRDQALQILAGLRAESGRLAPLAVRRAYGAGIVAVDKMNLGGPRLGGAFGGVHQRQVEAMARNMRGALEAAVNAAGEHVEDVFARADALEGALRPDSPPLSQGLPFIGRRLDDPYRRVALDVLAEGTVALDTRRQISAELARRLVREGVTDATTGFVDRAGRRWPLDRYAAMVARTTTREASSRATLNRLAEQGLDLVTIPAHSHPADLCTPYEGRTYSARGRTPGYPVLDRIPPFHPNCRHVVAPASASLDAFERELGLAARNPEPAPVPEAPTPAPTPAPPRAEAPEPEPGVNTPNPRSRTELDRDGSRPVAERTAPVEHLGNSRTPPRQPFIGRDEPIHDEDTQDRLDAELVQRMIENDPGPEPGYLDGLDAELREQAEARYRATRYEDLDVAGKRRRTRELTDALGADTVKAIRSAEARKFGLEHDYWTGAMTREELDEELWKLESDRQDRADRRAYERERRAQYRVGAFPCFSCNRFKPRPSAICTICGDDPVCNVDFAGGLSHGGDYWEKAAQMDRDYGYDGSADYGD